LSWRLEVSTESTRRSGDDRLFQARGAATANERSPSDNVVGPTCQYVALHCDRARRGGSEVCSGAWSLRTDGMMSMGVFRGGAAGAAPNRRIFCSV